MAAFSEVYDARYRSGYREKVSGYEVARWKALSHFIPRVLGPRAPEAVLDYGAGSGLHVALWEKVFPGSDLSFCDVSSEAKERFAAKFQGRAQSYRLVRDNRADYEDGSFDVVVSVEVMEHVEDLGAYLKDILRLLKPGGRFVWTTPCGNALSIEHVFSAMTGRIEKTAEGLRRWTWEDPTHLRRLKTRELEALLRDCGYGDVLFRFRSHVFSFVCAYAPPRRRLLKLRERLMLLDYGLLRRLPNGASMLGSARRPGA
jgi:SAM-dependent methyltransferase